MKRWIVFGLVALAVIVLVSPGIVGKLAEQNLKDNFSRVDQENSDLVVTEEKFERGWFTAEGRHRVTLREGFEPVLPVDSVAGGRAALLIETRIDHGPVPVTSMSRDAGSLQPALASTISTLSLDLGDGRIVELPGRLSSRIGLTGATTSHYALEEGSFRDDGLELRWQGADIRFSIDAAGSALEYRGRVEPWRWSGDDGGASLGTVEFDGEQQQTAYGFSTGKVLLRMADGSLEFDGGDRSGFGSLALEANSRLVDARIDGASSLDVDALDVPGVGRMDLDLAVAVERLDAARVKRIREALEAARESQGGEPGDPLALYPLIERDLQALLGAGAALRISRFVLVLPQGEVTATVNIDLPETTVDKDFSWPSMLLALKASADVRVPAALVEAAQAANPQQAGALIAMGFLKRDGDAYVMQAEYAQGLVTVNGAPMPLPLHTGQTSAID